MKPRTLLTAVFVLAPGLGKAEVARIQSATSAPAFVADNARTPAQESPATMSARLPTLNDYEFVPPEGWQVAAKADQILVTQTPDQTGCLMRILPPQPSSGDLERDAKAVFDLMYQGWNYQQSGARQYTLSRGILPKGLPFSLYEAPMNAMTQDGRYHLEEGVAFVVKTGPQVVIIGVRHRGLMAHVDCQRKYTVWRRFFNSFTVKNVPVVAGGEPDPAQRLVGVWDQAESGAVSEYVFAANGRYAHGGTLGTASTTRDVNYEYLHIKTYGFEGDGHYALSDSTLTLQRAGESQAETVRYRFEQANHGGTGWKDRLWLLKNTPFGENEVCYERRALP